MSDKRTNKNKWKRLVEYVTKIEETPLPEAPPPDENTDTDKDEGKNKDEDNKDGKPIEIDPNMALSYRAFRMLQNDLERIVCKGTIAQAQFTVYNKRGKRLQDIPARQAQSLNVLINTLKDSGTPAEKASKTRD